MIFLKKIFILLLYRKLRHAATLVRKVEDTLFTGFDSGSEFADYLEQLIPCIRGNNISDKDLFRLWQIFAPTGDWDNLPLDSNTGDFISWLLDRLYGKRLKQIIAIHRAETQNTYRTQTVMIPDQEKLNPEIVKGDLLDQKVDVIVNAWNRNVIPWWLLLPQGVSGAIKKRGGRAPFKEVAKAGIMPLGSAVLTGAGRLPLRGIIHVAGINLCWTATEYSVRQSVRSAVEIVNREGFQSVAFPIIGSGSGNRSKKWALDLILDEFKKIESSARVVIVAFVKEDNVHG